jgi:hypothetical protein
VLRWLIGAARLDPAVYEELAHEYTATVPALLVVVLACLASGVALLPVVGLAGVYTQAATAFISWTLFVVIAYVVGTKALPGPATSATIGQLVRALGFAQTPALLLVLGGVVPGVLVVLVPLVAVWVVLATIVALRAALDVSTGRTLVIVAISLFGFILVSLMLAQVLG